MQVMRSGGIGKGGSSPPKDGIVIQEKQEPAEWKAVLGNEPYANAAYLKKNKSWRYVWFSSPRLLTAFYLNQISTLYVLLHIWCVPHK